MIKNQSAAIANMNRNEGSLPALVFAAFIFMILIPTLLVLVGTFLDHVFGLTSFMAEQFALRAAVSIILFAVGGSLAVLSNTYLIKRGKGYAWGDASPSAQTKVLVTAGPYKYTRNPMILGYTMLLSSVGILVGSLFAGVITPLGLLVLISAWIKIVEEPKLEARFGKAYIEYKRKIPFLIPRLQKKPSSEKT